MRITILTLFPEVFDPILETSIIKRARKKDLVNIELVNIRDFADDRYKTVDDRPYGGGVGMIMRVNVLYRAISNVKCQKPAPSGVEGSNVRCKERIILLDPKGERFTQEKAKKLAKLDHLMFLCGHYEAVDARIERYVDDVISIGNYILTGGEIPAMVLTDSIVRLIPGVLPESAVVSESFEENLLEYPQYTRPPIFRGQKVPEVLLSGNHKMIEAWRKSKQRKVTGQIRH